MLLLIYLSLNIKSYIITHFCWFSFNKESSQYQGLCGLPQNNLTGSWPMPVGTKFHYLAREVRTYIDLLFDPVYLHSSNACRTKKDTVEQLYHCEG